MNNRNNPGLVLAGYSHGDQNNVGETACHSDNYQGTNLLPLHINCKSGDLVPFQIYFRDFATFYTAFIVNKNTGVRVELNENVDYEIFCSSIPPGGDPLEGYFLISSNIELDCGNYYYEVQIGSSSNNFRLHYSEVFHVLPDKVDCIVIEAWNTQDKEYAIFQTGWRERFFIPKDHCIFNAPQITIREELEINGQFDIVLKASRVADRKVFETLNVPDWALMGLENIRYMDMITVTDQQLSTTFQTKDYQFSSRAQAPGLNIGVFSLEQTKALNFGCDVDYPQVTCDAA